MDKKTAFILWFDQVGIEDTELVGGKNASLGEMYRMLTPKGVNIPNGFIVTARAYWHFIKKAGIQKEIKKTLKGLNTHDVKDLAEKGRKVRKIILDAELPQELKDAICDGYKHLCIQYGKNTDVAVRSSATAEDLPGASFAGQQETYLNIRGEKQLLEACRKCFASLFTNRAISYRADKGFGQLKVALSIGVQKMVRSDKASSGVIFTIDTESGFRDVVYTTAGFGLGENIVQGKINPDEYYVFKPTLKKGFKSVISKKLGPKKWKMVYDKKKTTRNIRTSMKERKSFCLNDDELLTLARWSCIVEDHYAHKYKRDSPMDLEWAKDGITKQLFILQARPETVHSLKEGHVIEKYLLQEKGKVLTTGSSVGEKIGQGKTKIINNMDNLKNFKKGEVLVTDMTNPDMEPVMKLAKGIVTDKGGRTCFGENTRILTNKGFYKIKDIYDRFKQQEGLFVLSLDNKTNKIVWRPVIAVNKRRSTLWKAQISPTLRSKQNHLEVTLDHKFFTLKDRSLCKEEIRDIIQKKEGVLIADKIPQWGNTFLNENKAYLFGALLSDGFTQKNKQGGYVVGFVQKIIPQKKEFINTVRSAFKESYNRNLKLVLDKRGNIGSYQCYSKNIYEQLMDVKNKIVTIVLSMDEPHLLHFLAGIIDGDGNLSHHQIQVTVSENNGRLLEAIIIASYRVGIIPTICKRKSWYVISYNEGVDKLLAFTKRVKGNINRHTSIKRVLSRQILSDVVNQVNKRGRIKHDYIARNLMMSKKKIEKDVIPNVSNKKDFERLTNSDFYMNRAKFEEYLGEKDVYNLTVEAAEEMNHNYIVFTSNYTPVIVSNCHAAIVSRELGVPCIIGTTDATRKIKTGKNVTVDCSQGETGFVYDGLLKFKIDKINLKTLPKTKTEIMMNLGEPEQAFKKRFLPNKGVGLAREEFIINSHIKIHPLALINFKKLKDKKVKKKITELTYGYKNKTEFFVNNLAYGIAILGAAFYPHDVIVRFSDFKSNEYANLIGGKSFEPTESNPMIGWRGASRYYSENFKEAFALECRAILKVRNEMGLHNVKVMIPFCRTLEEGKKVIQEMKKNGLNQGENGLEVYVMCEIPSNVVLADQFAQIFDGFSIGSNDLTQLTLGLDRDSALVSSIFDERNEAVKRLVSQVIDVAKKNGKKIGICGDAPSTFPDFAKFLVECGINSMSLTPDAIVKTILIVAEEEKKMQQGGE